ncbi:replication initiation protein, partial [Escherichia coli]|nr:replication initiation protein [Escherichia coli]
MVTMKIKENVKQELREQSLVTQSNKLIEGSYSVNLSEIRLLWLALTKVDSKLPQPEREYTLTAGEYSAMYGLD